MGFKMLYFRKGKNLQVEGDRLLYIEEVLKEISLLEMQLRRIYIYGNSQMNLIFHWSALKEQEQAEL